MSAKVLSLTAHRNTRAKRERHATSYGMIAGAKKLARGKNVSGYVVIAFSEDFGSKAYWELHGIPHHVAPEMVKQHLLAHINEATVIRDDESD